MCKAGHWNQVRVTSSTAAPRRTVSDRWKCFRSWVGGWIITRSWFCSKLEAHTTSWLSIRWSTSLYISILTQNWQIAGALSKRPSLCGISSILLVTNHRDSSNSWYCELHNARRWFYSPLLTLVIRKRRKALRSGTPFPTPLNHSRRTEQMGKSNYSGLLFTHADLV